MLQADAINQFCSVTSGPNIAFVVVSFTCTELATNSEEILLCVRKAIRHSNDTFGFDSVRVTVLLPPGVHPSWRYFIDIRTKLAHLRFEFPDNRLFVECATTSNFLTALESTVVRLLCLALGVTWMGPLSQTH